MLSRPSRSKLPGTPEPASGREGCAIKAAMPLPRRLEAQCRIPYTASAQVCWWAGCVLEFVLSSRLEARSTAQDALVAVALRTVCCAVSLSHHLLPCFYVIAGVSSRHSRARKRAGWLRYQKLLCRCLAAIASKSTLALLENNVSAASETP